jgi:hypothetical protein
MNFMRDDDGVPHLVGCGIFTEKKICTCRKPAEAKAAQEMVDAASAVAQGIAGR